jgi:hypothetical protein
LVWFLAGYRVDYWVPVLNFETKGSETGIGPQKPVLNSLLFFIIFFFK